MRRPHRFHRKPGRCGLGLLESRHSPGRSGTITKAAERTGQHWGRQVVAQVPTATLRQINKVLGRNFVTKYGTRQGIVVLGRVAPFGIGAVIGGGANAALASLAVRAGRRAFGPAPEQWPASWDEPLD